MIRVTVELVPGGNEGAARVIASGRIVNDGTGDSLWANYDAEFTYPHLTATTFRARVEHWNRDKAVWPLVCEALNAVTRHGHRTETG